MGRKTHLEYIISIVRYGRYLENRTIALTNIKISMKIIKLIQNGTSRDYAFDHGYIVRRTPTRTQLYIPDVGTLRHDLLIEHHDSLLAGHFGAAKTGALLSRHYYWPQHLRDVREFVQA